MELKRFRVEGLNCGHCVRSLTELIEEVAGSSAARVELEAKTAEFEFDGSDADLQQLIERAKEEGFALTPNS